MRYLITGAAGFVGSHLCERLIEDGHEVVAFDNLSTGRKENIAHLRDRVEFHYGDCCEPRQVESAMHGCDGVFHLASVVGVKLVISTPLLAAREIMAANSVVFAECAGHDKPVVWTSTSEVYGRTPNLPCCEDADLIVGPPTELRWTYAAAKLASEFLARSYWEAVGLPVVTVRLFNVSGNRQLSDYGMVLPTFVRQAIHGKPLTVYGDGQQTRCFCHVKEVVRGLVELMECQEAAGEVVNLGSDEEVTIGDLATEVCHAVGVGKFVNVPYAEAYGSAVPDMARRVPCLEKAKRLIGWSPKLDVRDIVADVLEYERKQCQEQSS